MDVVAENFPLYRGRRRF